MSSETNNNEFKIPSFNVATLEGKIAKLNKRAAKNGLKPIELIIGDKELVCIKKEDAEGAAQYREYTFVTVVGETPIVEGWKIIGAVEHINGVNLIANAPGVEHVDNKYRERPAYCDHCNTKRVKKYSFIIENIESGETKQVGRSCLKDFFNAEIKNQLAYLEWFTGLILDLEDEESDYYGCGGAPILATVVEILEWASFAVRTDGYKKSDWENSTKNYVSNLLWNPKSRVLDDRSIAEPTAEDKKNALGCIEWIESAEAKNDYITTLKDLVKAEAVPYRFFGYVVSAIPSFLKVEAEIAKKKIEAERPFLDEYAGEVKKREDFELELHKILGFDNQYGTSYLHIFSDSEGRSFTWWYSNKYLCDVEGEQLKPGAKIKLKATVKEHKLYNEKKQTVLTRGALQEYLEDFS
jgi:hypothetical protein